MINYDSKSQFSVVSVMSLNEFFIKLDDGGNRKFNRQELEEVRMLIDKALNTSEEELEAF